MLNGSLQALAALARAFRFATKAIPAPFFIAPAVLPQTSLLPSMNLQPGALSKEDLRGADMPCMPLAMGRLAGVSAGTVAISVNFS